jgi:quinol monooxygenase YgiN
MPASRLTSLQQHRMVRAIGFALMTAIVTSAVSASAATNAPVSDVVPYANLSTLHVKPVELAPFETALSRNAVHARLEPGNLSFTVFQSIDSPDTLYVLEQWKDQAAYRAHLTQPALLQMHDVAKTALIGPISHMRIVPATADAGLQPAHVEHASETSNVLVFLSVKPAESARFHSEVAAVTPIFRAAPGNLAFDVYQDADHPDQMVQLERWTGDATHQANLKRPVIATIRSGYAVTLAKPMLDGRVLVKDITDQ